MQENTAYKILSFSNSGSLYFHLPRSHTSVFLYPHLFPVFFSFFFLYCFLPCCYYFFAVFLLIRIFFCIFFTSLFCIQYAGFSALRLRQKQKPQRPRPLGCVYFFCVLHYTAFFWQSAGIACILMTSSLYIRIEATIWTSMPQPNIPMINIMFSANIPRLNIKYMTP